MPLNTHGGLLSYGHCGVGGAMAHLVETHLQMTGRAAIARCATPRCAAAWRRRRAVVACQHVPGAGAMSDKLATGPRAEAIVYQHCAACGAGNISAAPSARPAARRNRHRSAPAARGRCTPPRWSAGQRRRRPGHICPTTSCWSIRRRFSHDGPWRQCSRHR
jgi:hypothetical protein